MPADIKKSTTGAGTTRNTRLSGRHYIAFAIALSIATNLLLLVSPLYMIQVYDRVLTSSSVNTLVSLSLIAVFLLGIYAFAEAGRRRALAAFGKGFADRAGMSVAREQLRGTPICGDRASLQDVSRLQSFLFSGGILPVLDLPFSPLFLALMFLLHPVIGFIGLGGAVLLIAMAVLSEKATSKDIIANQKSDRLADAHLAGVFKASNAVRAMGMQGRVLERWHNLKSKSSQNNLATSSLSGFFTGSTRSIRQILQAVVLGTGAYLALQQQMSPGAIVAGSIIMGRGLAPIDQVVGAWRQIGLARDSWKKIRALPVEADGEKSFSATQSVEGALTCQSLAVAPPGAQEPVLAPFSLTAEPGSIYGLVGASGSGKSTMLQAFAGLWKPLAGHLTLAGRDPFQWPDEDRGRFIGYLPQQIELLPGTAGENIARFTESSAEEIEEIARVTGAHEAIMCLPGAYDTPLGPEGIQLSAGQQQIIGIARAFLGAPHLLLLDEPTANLDANLVAAFTKAVSEAKARGAIIVIATHDSRILPYLDFIVTTRNRQVEVSRKEDLVKQLRPVSAPAGGGAA